MVECPNCGKNNFVENKFCSECGTKLPPPQNYCPNCDESYYDDEKFCTECGTKLINKRIHKLNEELKKRKKELTEKDEISSKLKKKYGAKICPTCNNEIPKNAFRCRYCKTMLK